jgi:hypothetical protein
MFIKNPYVIKRKTIKTDNRLCYYLEAKGYYPIAKKLDKWVYIYDEKIASLIEEYKKGGDI